LVFTVHHIAGRYPCEKSLAERRNRLFAVSLAAKEKCALPIPPRLGDEHSEGQLDEAGRSARPAVGKQVCAKDDNEDEHKESENDAKGTTATDAKGTEAMSQSRELIIIVIGSRLVPCHGRRVGTTAATIYPLG
jgi:hypothetical protein